MSFYFSLNCILSVPMFPPRHQCGGELVIHHQSHRIAGTRVSEADPLRHSDFWVFWEEQPLAFASLCPGYTENLPLQECDACTVWSPTHVPRGQEAHLCHFKCSKQLRRKEDEGRKEFTFSYNSFILPFIKVTDHWQGQANLRVPLHRTDGDGSSHVRRPC